MNRDIAVLMQRLRDVSGSCVSCVRRRSAYCDDTSLRDLDLSDYLALGARPIECPGYQPTESAARRLVLIDLGRIIDRLGSGPEVTALRDVRAALRARVETDCAAIAGELPVQLGSLLRRHARCLLDRANSSDPDTLVGQDEAERVLARYLNQWAREVEDGTWSRWERMVNR